MALACLAAAGPVSAKPKREHILAAFVDAPASNGYYFSLQAFRGQPGGATVTASFYSDRSSAIYVRKKPAIVTKHRIKADLGELGVIDLRIKDRKVRDRDRRRCGRTSFATARLRGGLHLESDFSHVRTARLQSFIFKAAVKRSCADSFGFLFASHPEVVEGASEVPALTACDSASGAGLLALRESLDGDDFFFGESTGTEFVAVKTTREDGLERILTTSSSGPTHDFGVSGRTARVNPPEPFSGRAHFRNGRLEGNLRVSLPGEGGVRLTPSKGELGTISSLDSPKCFPAYYGSLIYRPAVDQAVAAAIQRTALSQTARRALGALGD